MDKEKNNLDLELNINGRTVKPHSMVEELNQMTALFTSRILALKNPSSTEVEDIVKDMLFESVSLSVDYAQSYCSKIDEEYKSLFLNANIGIGFSDTSTKKIISVNPYFCKMLEIEPDDIEGKNIGDFFKQYIVDIDRYELGKEIFKKDGFLNSFELKFKTKTGLIKYFLVSSKNIPDSQQEAFSIVDATALKEVEIMREYTTNILTHDVRSPLTGALLYSDFMVGDKYSDEQKRYFALRTKTLLERINNIISDHLDIMKFEKGTYKLKVSVVNVNEFLGSVCERINHNFSSRGCYVSLSPDVIFDNDTESGIDDLSILADKKWLEHLFDNLVNNALEEAEKNGSMSANIKLNVEKGNLFVHVHNKGAMPDSIKQDIFIKRYLNSTKISGNGIGSYFASLVARIHNGEVYVVESNIENGTDICFRMPLSKY